MINANVLLLRKVKRPTVLVTNHTFCLVSFSLVSSYGSCWQLMRNALIKIKRWWDSNHSALVSWAIEENLLYTMPDMKIFASWTKRRLLRSLEGSQSRVNQNKELSSICPFVTQVSTTGCSTFLPTWRSWVRLLHSAGWFFSLLLFSYGPVCFILS